jgi:hypothetical protein
VSLSFPWAASAHMRWAASAHMRYRPSLTPGWGEHRATVWSGPVGGRSNSTTRSPRIALAAGAKMCQGPEPHTPALAANVVAATAASTPRRRRSAHPSTQMAARPRKLHARFAARPPPPNPKPTIQPHDGMHCIAARFRIRIMASAEGHGILASLPPTGVDGRVRVQLG